jgi:CDP-diacylglycerol--glycerol-3-phosphate 3-phosphatidyltransferase
VDGAHGGEFDQFGIVGVLVFYAAQLCLAAAVAMTMWSGYEFYRAVWQQRDSLRGPATRS